MVFSGQRKTVLITGATGMVGRAVVELLTNSQSSSSWDFRAQVRNPPEARAILANSVDLHKVLLREADFARVGDREMRYLTKDCHTIIHCAGLVHRPDAPYQEYEVANVRATQSLLETGASNNVNTFIFLSSSAVYGAGPYQNLDETGAVQAKTPYAVSKATSERFISTFPHIPRIVILRPSLVFGEGDRGNMLSMIREIKNNRFVQVGTGTTEKSVVYAKDLAYAIALCLNLPEGQHVFNVANPQPVTVKDLSERIADCLNLGRKISSVPEPLLRIGVKAAEILMPGKAPVTTDQVNKLTTTTTLSVNKLMSATGWAPRVSLDSALKAEIAWAGANDLI